MQKLADLHILETQIIQRDWDKRWERVAKIMDYDNSYTYVNESGVRTTLIPEKWIVTHVFDALMEVTEQ
jgi:hypothetical protein